MLENDRYGACCENLRVVLRPHFGFWILFFFYCFCVSCVCDDGVNIVFYIGSFCFFLFKENLVFQFTRHFLFLFSNFPCPFYFPNILLVLFIIHTNALVHSEYV